MIFISYILSLVMTTPSTTKLQRSSVDQPLEYTKSQDVGKLLILLIYNIYVFITCCIYLLGGITLTYIFYILLLFT